MPCYSKKEENSRLLFNYEMNTSWQGCLKLFGDGTRRRQRSRRYFLEEDESYVHRTGKASKELLAMGHFGVSASTGPCTLLYNENHHFMTNYEGAVGLPIGQCYYSCFTWVWDSLNLIHDFDSLMQHIFSEPLWLALPNWCWPPHTLNTVAPLLPMLWFTKALGRYVTVVGEMSVALTWS